MKANDHLFKLIKSLTGSEKRYFKLLSSMQNGSKNYLKLFDTIAKQDEYDEQELKKIFAKENFVKNFTTAKKDLYELIMKSLRLYNEGRSITGELIDSIKSAEILIEKSLIEQGKKILDRAKKQAYRYEKDELMLLILNLLYDISDSTSREKLLKEGYIFFERGKNFQKLKALENQLMMISENEFRLRDSSSLRKLDNIIKMTSDLVGKVLTNKAEATSCRIQAHYYFQKSDYYKSYLYMKKGVELFERNPHWVNENLVSYVNSLNNLCGIQLQLKKFSEVQETISKMRSIVSYADSVNVKIKLLSYLHCLETDYFIKTGEFNHGLDRAEKIQEWLEEFSEKVHLVFRTNLVYNLAYLHFGASQYKKAITILNSIFVGTDEIREDLQTLSRLLDLISHYEVWGGENLDYKLKSIYRFLYKKERLFLYEKTILNYFRKIIKIDTYKDFIELCKELKKELELLLKNPYESKGFEDFDLISWLDSKIYKRPFAEIVKEKNCL